MDLLEIAKYYNLAFNFNTLPLKDKAPIGDWLHWQKNIMSQEHITSFNWSKINGIGAVSGINNLRCLDFDHTSDVSVIKKFLRSLGLPSEYVWTVLSGSGKGYHIWFYCMDDSGLFNLLGGEKSYYKLFLKDKSLCDHIELRWKNCQTVLPPSVHPSGKKYKFLNTNDIPNIPPYNVPVGKIISTLEKLCASVSQSQPVPQVPVITNSAVNITYLTEAVHALQGRISNYDDWMRVGFALASLGEAGRSYFLQISENNPDYNDSEEVLNKKFSSLLKDYRGDITISSLFEIAKKYGYEKPEKYFWKIHDNKAKIYPNLLLEFLESEGFSKMIINQDYYFVRDKENVISIVTKINIKDFVISVINKNSEGSAREMILEYLIRNINILSGEATLECLKSIDPEFIKSTKEKEFFYFNNNYLEVTREYIKPKNYCELKGKIWEKQRSKHDFHYISKRCEFQKFIENVCRKDLDRINALRSSIGYLLVSYKDPSCVKAVIFTDEKLSENAYGRSGKGLVARAISQMKNVLKIDGKNFSFNKNFMFQSVEPNTQLIIFDDVKRKFSFDKLFSILTEGMTIEKKNKNEYSIPFESSPKILITTNHTIEGNDDSSLDRQFVVEFSDYYNAQHKPKDDFGHLFFDEWNEEQWCAFYYFMADCCKYYLKNGLMSYRYVNLTRKKLIDSTAPEFEEFIKTIPVGKEINKKELFDQFRKEYEDYGQIKQNTLSKWTKLYADLYNLDVIERKSGLDRHIMFEEKS